MRIGRFRKDGREFTGIVEGERVFALKEDLLATPFFKDSIDVEMGTEEFSLEGLTILPPVNPSKIIAIGLNYKAHAAEFNKELPEEPMLFMKPPTAVIGQGEAIVYPTHMSRRVDYEGELAVVIGRRAKDVTEEEVDKYILGYTCFNDVTARDLQKKDIQYTRAKGFDTFAPMGPWIETDIDPDDVTIETYLNGERRQHTSTADMIFSVRRLVSFVSQIMTLLPGDVIATGTPSGVGKIKPGDTIEVKIEGIGTLVNTVIA